MTVVLVLLAILVVVLGIALASRSVSGGGSSPVPVEVSEALRTPLLPEIRDRVVELVRQQKRNFVRSLGS